jgi:hypothetical protein
MTSETSSQGAFPNPPDLHEILQQYGLGQYEPILIENGFDDWETVLGITESDMQELGLKLGHRRKLQRAIFEYNRGMLAQGIGSGSERRSSLGVTRSAEHPPPEPSPTSKRQYRRHPRPDPHAPPKPKSAYVSFGESVRKDPRVSDWSFSDISRETAKRWQELPADEKLHTWERPAAERFAEHATALEQYKKTENYRNHQRYLAEFHKTYNRGEPDPPAGEPSSSSLPGRGSEPSPERPTQASEQGAQPEAILRGSHDPKLIDADPTGPSVHPHPPLSPMVFGMSEAEGLLGSLGVLRQYFQTNPPSPEDLARASVRAFFRGTGALLHLWEREEGERLLQAVYHSEGEAAPLDTLELWAIAAVGSYCDSGSLAVSTQESFFHSFLSMFCSPMEIPPLHRMRLFTCLAICCILEERAKARNLVGRLAGSTSQSAADIASFCIAPGAPRPS